MILTCPECATSYFVDESRIPAEGRKVRCSTCGHRWVTGPDGQAIATEGPEAEFEPQEESIAAEEAEPDIAAVEPEPAPIIAPLGGSLADSRRGRSEERQRSPLVWAGVAAVVAALIAGVVVFREQIVRAWPGAAPVYAGLGLELAGGGLVLERDVKAQPAFLAGRPALSVSGAIYNPRSVPVDSPPLRVTLFDGSGEPVAAKIARPADASIPAKARRHYAITLVDPPASAQDLEVRFEGREHGERATSPVSARPAAPAAQEAPAEPTPATPAPSSHQPLSPAATAEHG